MVQSVKIYARIGELMQGILSDGQSFMVSGLPSPQWYSEASVLAGDDRESMALPPKAQRALSLFLDKTGTSLDGNRIRLKSRIPPGKGLASGSTDILSVLSVANQWLGTGLDAADLYSLAAQVEPTDPCLTDDILVFYPDSGHAGEPIALPPMALIYVDTAPAGIVPREHIPRPWTPGVGKFYDWLLSRFQRAAAAGDYETIFDCITASAEYNQTMVPIPGFEHWMRVAGNTRSALLIAHSGTIAGLLSPPERIERVQAGLSEILAGKDRAASIFFIPSQAGTPEQASGS